MKTTGTPSTFALPPRRALRRAELRKIVPLARTTIYEMEQRGEFPKRFYLTPRCVVWDSDEVYAWLDERKRQAEIRQAAVPNALSRKGRLPKSST